MSINNFNIGTIRFYVLTFWVKFFALISFSLALFIQSSEDSEKHNSWNSFLPFCQEIKNRSASLLEFADGDTA